MVEEKERECSLVMHGWLREETEEEQGCNAGVCMRGEEEEEGGKGGEAEVRDEAGAGEEEKGRGEGEKLVCA